MERRARARHSIHLDVNVIDKLFRSWVFSIEDFGLDGLYLSCRQGVPDSIQIEDLLELRFDAEEGNTRQSYAIKVKVLRKLDRALAIAIYNPAYEALLRISKQQQKQLPLTDVKAKDIYSHLEKKFLAGLSDCIESFFPDCNDFLFSAAEQSTSNVEQAFFFDAINTLNSCKAKLKDEFLFTLSDRLNLSNHDLGLNSRSRSDTEQELGLLEQNDFENWLVVEQMIKASVPHYKQQLSDIDQRLVSLLSIEPEALDYNPFSPDSIFKSFNESVHHYFTDNETPEILCKEFEKTVNNKLSVVYDDLNQLFVDNGVLTFIGKKELEIKKSTSDTDSHAQPGKSTAKENKENTQDPVASEHNRKARSESAIHPSDKAVSSGIKPDIVSRGSMSTSSYPASSVPFVQGSERSAAVTPVTQKNSIPGYAVKPVQYVTEIATLENNINLNNAYQTLKEILSFQTRHSINDISADIWSSDRNKHQLEQLIDELTSLQQSKLSDQHIDTQELTQVILKYITKDNYSPEVLDELEYTLDILGRLFSTIYQDEWLTAEVRNLICSLQLPMVKVALLNKDFFTSWSNPARMVINKLAMINFDDDNNHFYLRAKSYIDMIIRTFDRDLSAFTRVQEVLSHLLDLQSRQYNANVEKITIYWDAQQTVAQEIAQRLADKPVPLVFADFISYQWLQILLNTYQAQGKDSIEWQQYIQVLQVCVMSCDMEISEHNVGPETILFIIKKGLSQSGLYNKKIVDNIEQLLRGAVPNNSIVLSQQQIFQLLINGYALSDESAVDKISRQTIAKNRTKTELVNKLQVNDYLIHKQKTKNVRLQLVWKSEDHSVLVLIGRTGQQEAVLNLVEVVTLMEKKQLYQTHYFELPILERSIYAILGDVHGKLAVDSQVDPVTHFMFRKEFEQILRTRLSDIQVHTQAQNRHIALCMINIDRFSLINNTFGFECGDRYLTAVAELIAKSLPEGAVIARYGIDEFIMLFNNLNEKQLVTLAEKQRQSIQNFDFEWEDKNITLSASIGLTMAHVNGISMNRLINAVATAMSIAKEHGRNRVFFFAEDDAGLNYRQQLQIWATKVEQMIARQQLDVRFHRIHPLTPEVLPHYEVLLVVKDRQGKVGPPAEFIEAAELYNKMVVVDQWVIDYVFNWCELNPVYFEKMEAVSINLSGHSLNSVDFVDYVSAKFTQYKINPSHICFEITETVAIANMDCTINLIQTIKEMGCKFSLDDFGTGMSSYAYLKNLPVDYLKIDGIFIKDIASNEIDQAMVKSINEIGHILGIHTIAEYVENDEIISVLKSIGVDYAQGFGVEKPIMMNDFLKPVTEPE